MRTHRTLSTLITTLALAAALAAPASAASHTSTETPATAEAAIPGFPAGDPTLFNGRERNIAFRAAFAMENSDPATAFAGMMLLADAGYARAIDRIALYHLRGTGTPVDTARAEDWYRRAIAAGRKESYLALGKALLTMDRAAEARELIERAVDLEVASALTTRAVAHVRGQFGADSDPDAGWADLAVLALSGDRVAEINALRQLGQGAREGVDEDEIVRRVTARADEGDQWAAETLLYFYRARDMNGMDALAERKRLVAMPEVRARIATMEGLYIAYADDPGSFGEVSAGILDTARPEDFAAALRATARLDRNAYVRAVQNQLRARGYYGSRGSGRLTQPTIYAINRFCRDKGIEDACFHGPLASKAIRAIAGALGTP